MYSSPWTRKKAQVINRATPMKRKNFSVEEINLLKRLIQKYRPYQIENKKTDSVNLGEKQRIWESITNEFNSHFHIGEETSIKQLRKLWDNLKTRRKNELLREQLVKDEEGVINETKRNAYNLPIKDEVSDSLDSNTMSVDYYSLDDSAYVNGNNSNNWTLPIETVIVEDEDNNYKDLPNEDEDVEFEKQSFLMNNVGCGDERYECSCSRQEAELREKKLKLILREEEELYKMKKREQELKNEIADVQLSIMKEKKTYLERKRKLQLQLLSKQLQNAKRPQNENMKLITNCIQDSNTEALPLDCPVKISNNVNNVDVEGKYRPV